MRLVRVQDPYTTLRPGSRGTVGFIDAIGTVHVNWDDGRSLGLVPGVDEWVVLDAKELLEVLRKQFTAKYPEISAVRIGTALHNVFERALKKEFGNEDEAIAAIEAQLQGAS